MISMATHEISTAARPVAEQHARPRSNCSDFFDFDAFDNDQLQAGQPSSDGHQQSLLNRDRTGEKAMSGCARDTGRHEVQESRQCHHDQAAPHLKDCDPFHLQSHYQNVSPQPKRTSNREYAVAHQADTAASESYQALLHDALLKPGLVPPLPHDAAEQLADPDGAESIAQLAALEYPTTDEKWVIDKESAGFLAAIVPLPENNKGPANSPLTYQRSRNLKLEEPVLQTDPDMDLIQLFKKNEIQLGTDGIELNPLERDKDQSFEWPKASLGLPAHMSKMITEEKLELEKTTMEYLRQIHICPNLDLSMLRSDESKRTCSVTRVTSPMLPRSPLFSPERFVSPLSQVNFTSTPVDPSVQEMTIIEDTLFEEDELNLHQGPEDIHTVVGLETDIRLRPFSVPGPDLSTPLQHRSKRRQVLGVSTPVLPLDSDTTNLSSRNAKAVEFQTGIEDMIPPLETNNSGDVEMTIDEAKADIAEAITPLALPIFNKLEKEELNEADTLLRVPSTQVDEIELLAPWEEYADKKHGTHCMKTQKRLLKDTRNQIMLTDKKWTGASRVEKVLQWAPFPSHLGHIKPEEKFDDGPLARYVDDLKLEDSVNIQIMTWKPEGLRILDLDEYEEDDVLPASHEGGKLPMTKPVPARAATGMIRPDFIVDAQTLFPSKKMDIAQASCGAIGALVRKRKMQIEADQRDMGARANPKQNKSQAKLRDEADHMLNGHRGLSCFSKLQGWGDDPKESHSLPVQGSKASNATKTSAPMTLAQDALEAQTPSPSFPLPNLSPVHTPLSIIVSTTTMSNHHLIRQLSALLPALEIISRDNHFHPTISPHTSSLAEADITISPSTGLILTTLQTLKQKPLPGSIASHPHNNNNNNNTIHSQLTSVSTRYSHLYLLITDNRNAPLDSSDTTLLSTLTSRTTTTTTTPPQAQIHTLYLPTPDCLAHWIAVLISRCSGSTPPSSTLLSDETHWERFLRYAGMNSFAAQTLLRAIHADDESDGGLAAFVAMGAEERSRRYAGLLGGEEEGVWMRVNAVLDKGWISAANGKV